MTQLLTRFHLFFSTWEPAVFYPRAAAWGALCALVGAVGWLAVPSDKRRFSLLILSVAAFFSASSAFTGLLISLSHRFSPLCLSTLAALSLAATYFFAKHVAVFIDDLLPRSHERLLGIGVAALSAFYLMSIDHNYVPPQYDVTTYETIGELLFRYRTYPTVPYAGAYTMTVFPTPGYFFIDHLARLFWPDPRVTLLVSWTFLITVAVALSLTAAAFFRDGRAAIFTLIACFSRGLLWSYWEFNMLRHLSIIAGALYLLCTLLYFRTESLRKGGSLILFAHMFLAGAAMAHLENVAYMLFAAAICSMLSLPFIRSHERFRGQLVFYALGFALPAMVLGAWYVRAGGAVVESVGFLSPANLQIPVLRNFLFHINGIVPMIAWIAGVIWMLKNRSTRAYGIFFGGIFVVLLISAYYLLALHYVCPEKFPMSPCPFDDFTGSFATVRGFLRHPYNVILKITGFWWVATMMLGWVLTRLWEACSSRKWRLAGAIFVGGLMFGDVFYLYYNKPIITADQVRFLKDLKSTLPADAVMVGPPGYHFSAWIGPLTERGCLSGRIHHHSRNTLSPRLITEVEVAYASGNFDFFKNSVKEHPLVILFTDGFPPSAAFSNKSPLFQEGSSAAYLL